MTRPYAIMFDLDDTLADSFKPPKDSMVEKLGRLLEVAPIAIISAAGFPRIESDFLHKLAASAYIDRFFIFANSSAQCFEHKNGEWKTAYNFMLTEDGRAQIREALREAVEEIGLELNPKYAPMIIDRDVQIAYAALGLSATEEDKRSWDPDKSKRKRLKDVLDKKLPDYEVLIGGKTTIDITHKGITKAYGVKWFSEKLGIAPQEMLYVGDAFYEGGNDTVVIETGIQTRSVTGPSETESLIEALLAL